ncbi:MAG: hypothetical protein IBX55_00615 [Methyloprofundus sp.]|nr:hypothetical protein [Methyloprofundus sp.]
MLGKLIKYFTADNFEVKSLVLLLCVLLLTTYFMNEVVTVSWHIVFYFIYSSLFFFPIFAGLRNKMNLLAALILPMTIMASVSVIIRAEIATESINPLEGMLTGFILVVLFIGSSALFFRPVDSKQIRLSEAE